MADAILTRHLRVNAPTVEEAIEAEEHFQSSVETAEALLSQGRTIHEVAERTGIGLAALRVLRDRFSGRHRERFHNLLIAYRQLRDELKAAQEELRKRPDGAPKPPRAREATALQMRCQWLSERIEQLEKENQRLTQQVAQQARQLEFVGVSLGRPA